MIARPVSRVSSARDSLQRKHHMIARPVPRVSKGLSSKETPYDSAAGSACVISHGLSSSVNIHRSHTAAKASTPKRIGHLGVW